MKKGIGIAVAIVVIILIAFFANRGGDEQEVSQGDGQPQLVSMTDGDNTVVVSNQDSGDSATVNLINLVNSGFVVIHEDADGTPGADIGVSGLLIGSNENVVVNLDRPSVAGETLYAMLHTDDGDGVYTFPGPDAPLQNSDDQVLVVAFKINGEASTDSEESEMNEGNMENEENEEDGVEVDAGAEVMIGSGATVVFNGSSYSPSEVTIKKGEKVTFRNESSTKTWPASAFHPTHTAYPGSDIKKCGTSDASNIFDSCGGLELGQTYSFTFSETGSWNYHDHLSPSKFGKVIVVE